MRFEDFCFTTDCGLDAGSRFFDLRPVEVIERGQTRKVEIHELLVYLYPVSGDGAVDSDGLRLMMSSYNTFCPAMVANLALQE